MTIIEEPEHELEVHADEVEPHKELTPVGKYEGELRWVRALKTKCVTCETEKCFDDGWHAGHIFYPHLESEDCEVEETVLLGEETTEEQAREEIPDYKINQDND